jgi:hypothetical protein
MEAPLSPTTLSLVASALSLLSLILSSLHCACRKRAGERAEVDVEFQPPPLRLNRDPERGPEGSSSGPECPHSGQECPVPGQECSARRSAPPFGGGEG